MPKINEGVIPKNIDKLVETVYELKGDEYKVPSFEEFMETYEYDERVNYDDLSGGGIGEVKGYGPCPDIWNKSDSVHKFDDNFETLSFSTKGRAESGANRRVYASAGADFSGFRYRDGVGDLKLLSYSAGAEAGIGWDGASVKYKLGVDIANAKAGGVKSNFGVDVGSEASIGEGSAKLKVGGVGFSIGKEIGFSTPLGGISVNLEEASEKCIIQ